MAQPRITLEQWQALVAVVEAGSHAKAAEMMHKTQSTITYAIRKIESLLAVKAFEIRGRKAVLTPTGQLLYRRAKVLLEESASLETAARRVSAGWEAEIRVAMEHIFPNRVMFQALDRFNAESPHTHIELVESVIAGTTELLTLAQVDLAVTHTVPPGFVGDVLLSVRMLPVAHPEHPLHKLGRPITNDDLRRHRQLVVRESGSTRSTRLAVEATQRWTVSHMSTSIMAARTGYGYAWLPEERIREELAAGTLKALPLREGRERHGQLYLVYADRESAGPGVLRLGEIMRATLKEACAAEPTHARPESARQTPRPRRRRSTS